MSDFSVLRQAELERPEASCNRSDLAVPVLLVGFRRRLHRFREHLGYILYLSAGLSCLVAWYNLELETAYPDRFFVVYLSLFMLVLG
jgi:hypothetical protein